MRSATQSGPTGRMMRSYSFAAVADARARVLVLGSLPGRTSLAKHQYYALPQNSFWKIMGALFGFAHAAPYAQRLARLRASGVALWDVCHSAHRPGSLDSAIEPHTVRANDFARFLRAHPGIDTVFFNGGKAAQLYERLVFPALPAELRDRRRVVLPSTSPAHASLTYAAKLARWAEVAEAAMALDRRGAA
jgi:TDG/mug DNA glycosylase family protein